MTPVALSTLQERDRFYKATDKKKQVWQIERIDGSKILCKRGHEKHATPINGSTSVIFLRRAY